MKNNLSLLLSSLCITAFIQCSEPAPDTQQQTEEMLFRVDSALIGDKIAPSQAGYNLNIPQGWAVLSAELADSLGKKAISLFNAQSSGGTLPTTSITAVAKDSTSNAGFIAASYALPDSIAAQQFMEQMLQKQPDVQYATFTKKGLRLHQGLTATNDLVMFSILFQTSCCKYTWQALHYIIPKSQYNEKTAGSIETSLGTLSLSKQ